MAEYDLLTIWRLQAPIEDVYATIRDTPSWPDWWPGVQEVTLVSAGEASGIDSVWRYVWQGKLPYRLTFDVRATRIEEQVAIEGSAHGDLEGIGCWHFSSQGEVTVVRCAWHVRSTRWWMNLVAPLARAIFIRNHTLVMEQGGRGLARQLGARLLGQENIDLLAAAVPLRAGCARQRESGRIDPAMVIFAGIFAGVIATMAQLAMWWSAHMPLAETLFRDARLTAALLMGPAVLPPPSTAQWDILLVATLIHFALSIAYAVPPAHFFGRWRARPALLAGALYGLVIYTVNLYGLTAWFPWFAVSRDWATLLAHLVFGLALVAGCRVFARYVRCRTAPVFTS